MIINERYQLLEKIGRGGSARVWRACHQHGHFDLALKFLDPSWSHLGEDEFRLLTELYHPHIVRIMDMGPILSATGVMSLPSTPQLFLTMELVSGSTFIQLLEDPNEEFTGAEALAWLRQMVDVLQYLHGMRVKHRDIKPGNLMVDRQRLDPRAVLIDFNISELDDPMAGTVAYKCPLVELEGWSNFADRWALAVSFYELLTREFLFENVSDFGVSLEGAPPSGFPHRTFDALKRIIRGGNAVKNVDLDDYHDAFGLPKPRQTLRDLPAEVREQWKITSKNQLVMVLQLLNQPDRTAARSRTAVAREALRERNRPARAAVLQSLANAAYDLKKKGIVEYRGSAKKKKIALTEAFARDVEAAGL